MPEWRYILKRTVGKGRNSRLMLANQIKRLIKNKGLTIELPVMKVERTSSSEFYIGLAVNDARCGEDRVPDYVYQLFEEIGRPLSRHDQDTWPTPSNQVDGLLGGTFEMDYLTTPLRFEAPPTTNLSETLYDSEELEPPDCHGVYDQLLWWVSSKGFGNLEQLSEVSGKLGLTDLEGSVWAVVKKLSLLGHLDIFQDAERDWVWRVAPPTLVENRQAGIVFLAGSRTGRLQKLLVEKHGASLDRTNGGPSRIIVHISALKEVEAAMNPPFSYLIDPVEAWAELLPTADDWIMQLIRDPAIESEPHEYSFEHYAGQTFHVTDGLNLQPGFYRARRRGGQFCPKNVLKTPDGHWLNGDYATLRFLSLRYAGQEPQTQFATDGKLIIPLLQRWPVLYERALVLASGQLPSTHQASDGSGRLLTYLSVPAEAVQQLASKLNVRMP